MSWIELVEEKTQEAETARSWIYWACISAISAVSAPNVWLNRGGLYDVRPNTYIILYGPSGAGKGFPLNLASTLVKEVKNHTRVISGRNTIQSIITALGRIETQKDGSTPEYKDARGYIVSGEFSSLLQEDKHALTVLTDLYDAHYNKEWKNTTKTAGIDYLDKPNITLFSGASPAHFFEAIPKVNIVGGFIGRTLIIHETKRHKSNSLDDTDAIPVNYKYLAGHLKQIAEVKGAFTYSPQARELWRAWFYSIREKDIDDPTGQINRLPDHVLKVAMCLSLSRSLDKILTERDIQESIDRVLDVAGSNKELLKGHQTDAEISKGLKRVMELLIASKDGQLTQRQILRKAFGEFDTYALDNIAGVLERMGFITYMINGANTTYTLTPETMERWNKILEEEKSVH